MKCLVTGGAGFIGSTLVDRLLSEGFDVTAYDNLSTGRAEFISGAGGSPRFRFVRGDILDTATLQRAVEGCEIVYHLAANADIRGGTANTRVDIDQNTLGTYGVLEAMRKSGCKKIAFASSSAVYGDATLIPTPEDVPMPVQISLYGASKLAGEGMITAYCHAFDFRSWVFRFVSVLGPRYTHGHVFDFVKQLRGENSRLRVLGDGMQRKSYLHVEDCVAAIRTAVENAPDIINIFNLGTREYVELNQSIRWITAIMQLSPRLEYTGGRRGWIGDAPFVWLDPSRIMNLGWRPHYSIEEAIKLTADWLVRNPWALEAR